MKFLHSMIRVKNEEKSIRFYCELLGLKKGERIRLEDCYLQYLIDEKTNTQIELTINEKSLSDAIKNITKEAQEAEARARFGEARVGFAEAAVAEK